MWILPTRERPNNLRRFFDAFRETGATTPGIVYVDSDDKSLPEYQGIALPAGWSLSVAERIGLGATINCAFDENPGKVWYGLISDDAVPTTAAWDTALVSAAGLDGVAYCADGILNEKQAGHSVVGGDLARELGWLILPGLVRLYGDNVLTDITRERGVLRYLPDTRIEHWHFSNGKAAMDDTYQKPEASADKAIYDDWVARGRPYGDSAIFVCVNVGNYCGMGAQYVNILHDMVTRNLPTGFKGRFVCVTDNPAGLNKGIETLPMPEDLEGWWGKIYLFKRGLFPDGSRMVFMDLDTLIIGHLDEIVKYKGPFATLRDFYFPTRVGPAVMLWEAGGIASTIWDEWASCGKPRDGLGDLWWINDLDQGRFAKKCDKLQDLFPSQFVSFKANCQPLPPDEANVICFHGLPRPHECISEWVRETWRVGGSRAIRVKAECNVSDAGLFANIDINAKRNIPWIAEAPAHEHIAVICGSGPSILGNVNEIRQRQLAGQRIFALNNVCSVLNAHGIVPDYQVVLDARECNKSFIEYEAGALLLASQCHPSLFDVSANRRILGWHGYIEGIESHVFGSVALIGGGMTVGLSAMCLIHAMGYREMHLFGYDSCHSNGVGHAQPQPMNSSDELVDVHFGGKIYRSSVMMAIQAQLWPHVALNIAELDGSIYAHGKGLIPDIARELQRKSQLTDTPEVKSTQPLEDIKNVATSRL